MLQHCSGWVGWTRSAQEPWTMFLSTWLVKRTMPEPADLYASVPVDPICLQLQYHLWPLAVVVLQSLERKVQQLHFLQATLVTYSMMSQHLHHILANVLAQLSLPFHTSFSSLTLFFSERSSGVKQMDRDRHPASNLLPEAPLPVGLIDKPTLVAWFLLLELLVWLAFLVTHSYTADLLKVHF